MLVGGVDRETYFRINRYLATLLLLYAGIREDEAFTEVSKMFFSVRGVVKPRLFDASSGGLLNG